MDDLAAVPAIAADILSPSPSAVPAASASPVPDASATPVPATTPAPAEAAPAADAPLQPERSILSQVLDQEKPPEPAKAAEPEAKPADKPAEPTTPEPVKAEPIAWDYAVPETIKLDEDGKLQAKVNFDDEARTRVNAMFDAFAADPRAKANQQALIDYHLEQMAAQNKQVADFNRNYWHDTRKDWRGRWASDPEIGGSGMETSKAVAARVIDIALRPHDQSPANQAFRRELEEAFETTGAGDHPAIGKLLVRLGRFLDESPPPPPNLKPPADIGKPPGRGRLRDRYSNMGT